MQNFRGTGEGSFIFFVTFSFVLFSYPNHITYKVIWVNYNYYTTLYYHFTCVQSYYIAQVNWEQVSTIFARVPVFRAVTRRKSSLRRLLVSLLAGPDRAAWSCCVNCIFNLGKHCDTVDLSRFILYLQTLICVRGCGYRISVSTPKYVSTLMILSSSVDLSNLVTALEMRTSTPREWTAKLNVQVCTAL